MSSLSRHTNISAMSSLHWTSLFNKQYFPSFIKIDGSPLAYPQIKRLLAVASVSLVCQVTFTEDHSSRVLFISMCFSLFGGIATPSVARYLNIRSR